MLPGKVLGNTLHLVLPISYLPNGLLGSPFPQSPGDLGLLACPLVPFKDLVRLGNQKTLLRGKETR